MSAESTVVEGFSTERLGRIGPAMMAMVEAGCIPGAVTLIARHGRIVHHQAHGFLDAACSVPMPTDAVFRIYSMTKPLVSASAMALIEQGRMSLRDPVAGWLPELAQMTVARADGPPVPAHSPITVMDLLRHTSGVTYGNSAPIAEIGRLYDEADLGSARSDLKPEVFLERLGRIPLAWQPGTHWEYGVSTDILGMLLERVTGQRLDRHMGDELFAPLGMIDTGYQARPAQASRLADALDSDPQKAGLWSSARVESDPGLRYRRSGGGCVGSAHDYFRFAQMILNGGILDGVRILSRKTVQHMLSDHTRGLGGSTLSTTGPGYGFGLGFAVRRPDGGGWSAGSVGDAMWAGVGGTSFTIDPVEGIVGVVMAASPSHRQQLRFLFKDLIHGALVE